ncbi:ABC transporter ATP-binding protein [Anaeromicropila herbilytica]|uniref:Lantibiotic ABC transporter ATP-binding protein n=1 Tax=Anaeromicropila herbilytica TaxID=2785025 RepID=A0A7R7IBI8_9FIRM|nr:ABC transporter ATP-binding protein [Anaeromicropila herbilytica]BCN28834.1 lantibiotic ABC transporter ATP-binding protein [Anaeromicropila herbilytica]
MKQKPTRRETKRVIALILRTIKHIYCIDKVYFAITFILNILIGISSAASIWATKILINAIANVNHIKMNGVLEVLVIYAITNIIIQGVGSVSKYITSVHQMKVDYRVNMDILSKCNELHLRDFEDSELYNTLRRAEGDGATRVYFIYSKILTSISQLSSVISVAIMMLSWKSFIFLLALIVPIATTIVNAIIGYLSYRINYNRTYEIRKMSYINYLLTNDIAYKEIKIYNIGKYLTNIYSDIYNKKQKQDMGIARKRAIWSIILGYIDELIGIFIIFRIVLMAAEGKLLVGDTVAYINSLGSIQSSVTGFLNNMADIYSDILYIEEFYKFLDLEREDNIDGNIRINGIDKIEFRHVSYQYSSNSFYTLKNINFTIHRNEIISVIGENGSGKTTLIKLLVGFYNDYEGDIYINEVELRMIDKLSLHQQLGVIFQDYNNYEFTFRENFAFGNLDCMKEDNKIISILSEVRLNNIYNKLPGGLDTQMGHWFDGQELSRGQWQKVALGRAFIRDADVYILDEPTAALDPISENEIFQILKQKTKDKISILITHRVSNISEIKPRVLLIDNGTLIADGYHSELIENCSKYQQLYYGKTQEA